MVDMLCSICYDKTPFYWATSTKEKEVAITSAKYFNKFGLIALFSRVWIFELNSFQFSLLFEVKKISTQIFKLLNKV
jgi:hypothetical protein